MKALDTTSKKMMFAFEVAVLFLTFYMHGLNPALLVFAVLPVAFVWGYITGKESDQ